MTDKQRNVTKSIKSAPLARRVIRWIGAFGRSADIEAMIRFEIQPGRAVSAEIESASGYSPLAEKCGIGLLVDTKQTRLIRAWSGDAWTLRDAKESGETRKLSLRDNSWDLRYVDSWDKVQGLHADRSDWYCEAMISQPVYSAVIVTNSRSMDLAAKIGKIMNLPVIQISPKSQEIRAVRCEYCGCRLIDQPHRGNCDSRKARLSGERRGRRVR